LQEAEGFLDEASSRVGYISRLAVTEQPYRRGRIRYGGKTVEDVNQLKELDRENSWLKRIVAGQALNIDMLKRVR
jgi:putative transposase